MCRVDSLAYVKTGGLSKCVHNFYYQTLLCLLLDIASINSSPASEVDTKTVPISEIIYEMSAVGSVIFLNEKSITNVNNMYMPLWQ